MGFPITRRNPSIFNLVTFLFGVMFGDIGHGHILFAFGIILICKSTQYKNTFLSIILPHKYTIALMGFFFLYCGLIYNEYISISFNIFGSCYNIVQNESTIREGCTYPFEIDPIWSVSDNSLNFTNSRHYCCYAYDIWYFDQVVKLNSR